MRLIIGATMDSPEEIAPQLRKEGSKAWSYRLGLCSDCGQWCSGANIPQQYSPGQADRLKDQYIALLRNSDKLYCLPSGSLGPFNGGESGLCGICGRLTFPSYCLMVLERPKLKPIENKRFTSSPYRKVDK